MVRMIVKRILKSKKTPSDLMLVVPDTQVSLNMNPSLNAPDDDITFGKKTRSWELCLLQVSYREHGTITQNARVDFRQHSRSVFQKVEMFNHAVGVYRNHIMLH
jgi:hypothetical protein